MDTSPRERPPAPTRIPALGAEQLLAHPRAVVIDLRSPGEYAEDHVPGSVNVPLFDDDERALVGVLYNHASPERAFREGLEVVLAKVDALVERIAQAAGLDVSSVDLHETVRTLASGGMTEMERRLELVPTDELGESAVVVHCWRGGLRSQSVSALLRAVGLCDAAVLDGGYKAYRAQVREELLGWDPPPAYVLRGLTGVGKTLVLRELEGQRPGWTMDLEAAAGHRSSLLGMVGLEPVPQKTFESRLAERIRRGLGADRVVYEGESRKVGDAIVPPRIWESLKGGTSIELVAPVDVRIRVLMDDYLSTESNRPALRSQLGEVEGRMQADIPLVELFEARQDDEVVALLLEHYYDPLYRHSERNYSYALTVDSSDPVAAATVIAEWVESRSAELTSRR